MILKKYGIIVGAIGILMLMASNAFAVNINANINNNINSINNVKPGIHLNGSFQKRILEITIPLVNNPDIVLLLQEIVKKMNLGSVDSKDIEEIINTNSLEIGTVTSGSIITGDGSTEYYDGYCPGNEHCLRTMWFNVVNPRIILFALKVRFWAGQQFCQWLPFKISIGGEDMSSGISAWAFGYTGYIDSFLFDKLKSEILLLLNGNALLIIYQPFAK